ncbi:MAG TPA: ABC transporter ATP-binding protein [Vicinamibacterales bacterium]|nr:ABC transporter ATP-binding protein [Vicinamibacterales bacterium]
MAFIEVRGVHKSFTAGSATRHVLRDVSLDIEQGEFVSIVGAMGSGKSTLLSLLAGLTTPDGGAISIGGDPVRGVHRHAAFVFQNYSLLPWFTALENVRLAVAAAFPDLTREQQLMRASDALGNVGLGNAIHRRPRQLSGGMRQRVAIARAVATEPHVLFLDDPFGALDALTRETLQQELAGLGSQSDRRVTTVMITNSVEEAILLSDRIVPIVPGPPATLGAAIPVELPRPRSVAQLAHDEQATHVRAHVIATLTAAPGRIRKRAIEAHASSPVLPAVAKETS